MSVERVPLNGIKIIEFAEMVSGPYCGKLLADMGAEVIKVELPGGDPARAFGPFPEGLPHPEKSGLFLYNNTSKRGVVLDLSQEEGRQAFSRLVTWADALIDNHPPEVLEGFGLGWEHLHRLNPDLVYTIITPYGLSGPRAKTLGDELTVIHAGGLGNVLPSRSYDVDRAPVKLGGFQVAYHGGIAAALATLALLFGRRGAGDGRRVEISLQEVVLALVSPLVAISRYHELTWSRVPDRPPAMGRMQTSDGYVVLGAADDHHFRAFRELMGKPVWAAGDEWDNRYYRLNHLMDIAPQMEAWMMEQKKEDLHRRASAVGIPVGPINSVKDVMENRQYAARRFFVEVDHPEAGRYQYPGFPYAMSAVTPRVSRPAPLLGQHTDQVLRDPALTTAAAPIPAALEKTARLPLEGLRVLDFSWVWAGPYAAMLLGKLGAEVIKIEGHKRSDLTRRGVVWPLPEAVPKMVLPNQGLSYNTVNQNKKSLTLDLSRPEGTRLALRLAAVSDVVLDNMRPGAMVKLGLSYEALRQERPDIIVVTLSSRGATGPETNYLGFATIHQAVGGLAYLSGYPDDHPTHGSAGDADLMNGMSTTFAVLAALHHRRRTGEGQFIDYSQCEGVSALIGEAFLEYQMTGQVPERKGNTHPYFAPHAVYRCWGVDRWLALEVHTDEQFAVLARIIGRPELAQDPRFAYRAARKKNEAALDEIVGAWIRLRDRDWMANEFSQAGLFAAPSRDGRDLYADPHLRARGAFVTVNHPELGPLELVGPPFRVSGLDLPVRHAPLLGEHNDYVLRELLGLSAGEVEDLRKKEIVLPRGQEGRHLER